jgi:hypothetical protein
MLAAAVLLFAQVGIVTYPPKIVYAASSSVDLKTFGAKGDGVTDDTAAFNSAYASLSGVGCGSKGGVLHVPAGTYVVSSALSWMCTNTGIIRITGDSAGGTNAANGASTTIKYTGVGTFLVSRHLQMEHVRIETTTGATGIRLDRCNKDCWLDDLVITGFSTYGLDVSSATSQFTTTLSKLRLYSNTGWGLFISANRTTVDGCEINANTLGGILVDNAAQLSITNNSIESNIGPGAQFSTHKSHSVMLTGNYFEGNGTPQVNFAVGGGADGIVFMGNYLNGLTTTAVGVDCSTCGDGFFASNFSTGHTYGYTFPAAGGYRNTVIDTAPGSNTNDYDSKNSIMSMVSAKGFDPPVLTFATLAAAAGRIVYCTDCTEEDPCAASGTGALAKRINNRWDCN